jgi:hypothetical protein
MAGSINHCLKDDGPAGYKLEYAGVRLLENMRDMAEGVEEMMFTILALCENDPELLRVTTEWYYRCLRGEQDWPAWFREGRLAPRSTKKPERSPAPAKDSAQES